MFTFVSFPLRFNFSFEECTIENEVTEVQTDENGRPCFSSISKDAGFLDKELSASGFTKKDQEDIEKVCNTCSFIFHGMDA